MIRSQRRWCWLMISPVIAGLLIFTYGPMLVSLVLSFTNDDAVRTPSYVGLANYEYLLHGDPSFWISVRVTAYYAIGSVTLGLLASLSVALILNQDIPMRGMFRTLYYLPTILPATASGVLWAWIFHPHDGVLNGMLRAAGIAQPPSWTQSPQWALPAIVIMSIWGYGGAMVVFLAGLQDSPKHLHEAASLDGATAWRRFRVITWPSITPIVFFNLTMGLIGALKAFDQVFAFGTSGPGVGGPARATLFYVLNLYEKAFGHFHMGLAAAMAWLLFGAIAILTGLNFWLSKSWVKQGSA
jgi:multiple sugar transport system permease protein